MILMTVLFIKVLIWVGPLPTVYYLICLLYIYLNTNLQSLLDLLLGFDAKVSKMSSYFTFFPPKYILEFAFGYFISKYYSKKSNISMTIC